MTVKGSSVVTRFRQVMGRYPTGVTIVAAKGATAMVIGSFGSVSLDPPLVMFLPGKSSSSWPAIEKTGHFAVSVLGAHQGEVCQTVLAKGEDPFDVLEWHTASTGSPVLNDCLAWVDCRIVDVHDAGDHWIVVGEVLALGEGNPTAGPLVFWGGTYRVVGKFPAPD